MIKLIFLLMLVVSVSTFRVSPRNIARSRRLFSELADKKEAPKPDSSSKQPLELAKVNEESISSAAGVTGGVLGFIIGGPVFALIVGTASVYVSKKENEGGEALRGVGKAIVETYNYFTKLNYKFDISEKVSRSLSNALESSADSDTVEQIKSSVNKVKEVNDEYDITGKLVSAATSATTVSGAVYEKVEELNDKYDFVETAKRATKTTVERIKEASA